MRYCVRIGFYFCDLKITPGVYQTPESKKPTLASWFFRRVLYQRTLYSLLLHGSELILLYKFSLYNVNR